MGKVMVFDHPLIRHKIGIIRDENTNQKLFRELVSEIAMLMAYEVTRNMELVEIEINTPMCSAKVEKLRDDKISIVPILRAGLGMVDGMLNLLPNAKVGHIGLYRDHETLKPVPYYCKLPDNIGSTHVIVSVSYTHLDVYKRQTRFCIIQKRCFASPTVRIIVFHTLFFKQL